MKEYRLTAWPDLAPAFRRMPYHRMLSDMSQRYVSLQQLTEASGLRRQEVCDFLDMLQAREALRSREQHASAPLFGSLRPFGSWLRRAMLPSSGVGR